MSNLKTIFPLILSNTDMSLWSQCHLRWFRERCQCLKKYAVNIDLEAGGAFAKGLEVTRKAFYNDGVPSQEAILLGYNTILDTMYEREADSDPLKSPERMALAIVEYFRVFPLDEEEVIPCVLEDGSHAIEHKLTVELPFNHPELDVPLIFKGKLDSLSTSIGRTYIVDEKTTKQIAYNEGDKLRTSGQFIGYAWLARKHGIEVAGAKVRKVAIQVKEIKVKEFEFPITDYMIDLWERAMFAKVSAMVAHYKQFQISEDFIEAFQPDYQLGCTAYNRPCRFMDGCTSVHGEKFLEAEFEQLVWDSESQTEVSLSDFRKLVGLD